MPDLSFAVEQLEAAKRQLEKVISYDDSDGLNMQGFHWNNFVTYLDAVYTKSERGCQDIKNKFQPFQGYYKTQRRVDPVLRFLKESRDAAQHSIDLLCVMEVTGYAEGCYFTVESTDEHGNKILENRPILNLETKLRTFSNRGIAYTPPKLHLGKYISNPRSPLEVGELGVKFYSNYIDEINTEFKIQK
jgi:hypothetical protein